MSIFPGGSKYCARFAMDASAPKPFVVPPAAARRQLTKTELDQITRHLSNRSGVPDPANPALPLSRKDAVIFDAESLIQSLMQPAVTMLQSDAQSMKSLTVLVSGTVSATIKQPTILIAVLKQAGVADMQRKIIRNKGSQEREQGDEQDANERAALAALRAEIAATVVPSDPEIVYVDGRQSTWLALMREQGFAEKVRQLAGLASKRHSGRSAPTARSVPCRSRTARSSWSAPTTRTRSRRCSASSSARTSTTSS